MNNASQNRDRDPDDQIIRSLIQHENDLQNHRLTWLMTLQGLLFAALGFAWDKNDTRVLVVIFSILGIAVSLSAWSALRLSNAAYETLESWWKAHKPAEYAGPPIWGYRPDVPAGLLAKATDRFFWILRPWRILPWTFGLGWFSILVYYLVKYL